VARFRKKTSLISAGGKKVVSRHTPLASLAQGGGDTIGPGKKKQGGAQRTRCFDSKEDNSTRRSAEKLYGCFWEKKIKEGTSTAFYRGGKGGKGAGSTDLRWGKKIDRVPKQQKNRPDARKKRSVANEEESNPSETLVEKCQPVSRRSAGTSFL